MFSINSHCKILMVILFCMVTVAQSNVSFDQQKPNDISEKKWSSLKSVVLEGKLLPTPNLVGGDGSEYGFSVAIDGDRALVGAETMAGHGLVFVLELVAGDWVETDVLIPDDGESGDRFGASVSLSGNRALVGANFDKENGIKIGSAYIFDFDTVNWNQSAKLLADDAEINDQFGNSVGLSGDVALVGANLDNATSVDDGSAYIFTRNVMGEWPQTKKLIASDPGISDNFGIKVSIDGTRAIVGAIFAGPNNAGAVYVYDLNGTWSQSQILSGSGTAFGNNFGKSLDLLGDRCIIGASNDEGNLFDGMVYVFDFDSGMTQWQFTQKLVAANTNSFGTSVGLSADRIIIGASRENDSFNQSGSTYIFDLNGTWSETDKIVADIPAEGDMFGSQVAISGDYSIIGAPQNDDVGDDSGSAYIFTNNLNNWSQDSIHNGGDGAAEDSFGTSISVSGDWAVVGVIGDDDKGQRAGAAYVYQFVSGSWVFDEKLLVSDGIAIDVFGSSVSISGERIVVGAWAADGISAQSGAAYVFDLSGGDWIESQKLIPSIGGLNHSFGIKLSLFGDRVIIAAPFGKVSNVQTGLVFVFEKGATEFTETAMLYANDRAAFDQFGTSVSLGQHRALIGAHRNQDNGYASGSAYIFDFDTIGGSWSETIKLLPVDNTSSDSFGGSVSLSGDRALVGAIGTDDNGNMSGSAYVYDLDMSGWSETIELQADNAADADQFGSSVSLSGDRALVGAITADPNGLNSGSAYVFTVDSIGDWSQTELITPDDGQSEDNFGFYTAIDGNRMMISAVGDDDNGTSSGSVYALMIEKPDFMFSDGFE